jgi:hypothetical protein
MSTWSVPNSFTNGINPDAGLMNANFAAVKTFAEVESIQRDGSVAFTAATTFHVQQSTPRCGAQAKALAGGTSIPNTGTPTSITFTSENWDSGGFITPSSTNLTVPTGLAGIYLVTVQFDAETSTSTWRWGIYKNGVGVIGSASFGVESGSLSVPVACVVGDVFTVKASQTSAGALTTSQVLFSLVRLSL